MKACRKVPVGFDAVCLSGRIFRWRYARDCAADYLESLGVSRLIWDPENGHVMDALGMLPQTSSARHPGVSRQRPRALPSFDEIRARYSADGRYVRLEAPPPVAFTAVARTRALVVGLDVGSTMAKAVVRLADWRARVGDCSGEAFGDAIVGRFRRALGV